MDFAGVGSKARVKKLRLGIFFFPQQLKRNRDPREAFLGEEMPLWNGSTIICACQTFYISKYYPSVKKHVLAMQASDENGKSMIVIMTYE